MSAASASPGGRSKADDAAIELRFLNEFVQPNAVLLHTFGDRLEHGLSYLVPSYATPASILCLMKFDIETSLAAEEHLDELKAFDRKRILEAIEEQLSYQPLTPTRNRKELRPNPLANWALRVGKFRVLYNASEEEGLVVIVAVATKERNKFIIGGKEYDL